MGAGTAGYEDIRLSPDLTLMATISSNDKPGTLALAAERTQVRLMRFNAQTGVVTLTNPTTGYRNWGVNNQLGYSLDFSADSNRLYFSSVATGTTGSDFTVRYASVATATLPTSATDSAAYGSGGAVRIGPDGRMYWAAPSGSLRYLSAPDTDATSWLTLNLAAGTSTGQPLSNTLTD